MAEIEFFMNSADEQELAAQIFESGGELIPDLEYDAPSFLTVRELTTFSQCRSRTRLFFILYKDLTESPLQLRRIAKYGRDIHYVSQRTGGACIDWLCGARYTREGGSYVSAGSIGYHPSYYSTLDGRERKAPRGLVSRYRMFASLIRKDATRLATLRSRRVYFVTPRCCADFASGKLRLGPPFEDRQEILAVALAH